MCMICLDKIPFPDFISLLPDLTCFYIYIRCSVLSFVFLFVLSNEDLRMDRDKLMRALLMTEL